MKAESLRRFRTSLSATVDKNLLVDIPLTGGGNSFHPTILQDGVLYMASIGGPALNNPPGSTGFNTLGGSLTAADFLLFDPATDTTGTPTPNFAGDQMKFGLIQIFGAGASQDSGQDRRAYDRRAHRQIGCSRQRGVGH